MTPTLTIGPDDAAPGGCPTCSHTLDSLSTDGAIRFWHCSRCGTLLARSPDHQDIYRPKLVDRCREFEERLGTKIAARFEQAFQILWRKLGIAESINRPEDRPA